MSGKTKTLPIDVNARLWFGGSGNASCQRLPFSNLRPAILPLPLPLPLLLPLLLLLLLLLALPACSQPSFTANDIVPPLPANFDYGTNMGYFSPHYGDKALATLAQEYGASSIRPGLFHYFVDQWGYEIRKEHFQYYDSLGLRNVMAIIGFPSETARDPAFYCPNEQSQMFDNLYKPIWDNGENGTPVNDANPYALYVWKIATTYKGLIKTYEVWNEPDMDTGNGWLKPGQPGNWWENAPQPCETKLKSPPFFYIRTLRISYEVIKSIDHDALVAVGGLGWPSFLDVICRYTDEPVEGKEVPEKYPHRGGAYFDCMSFHAYPHLDNSLREWEDSIGGFRNFRHSDAAVDGLWAQKNKFKTVLDQYGYNNTVYPEKLWVCSEFNIPRRTYGDYIGSEAAQVNFLIKALVTAQMNDMAQMHVYSIADEKPENKADNEFAFMGLFKNLDQVPAGKAQPNAMAWAMKTTAQLLQNDEYHAGRTAEMNLPSNVRGAAFRNKQGQFTYILWAVTNQDHDETAEAEYAFPPEFTLKYLDAKPWHYSQSGAHYLMNGRQLKLTGSPVFLTETFITNDYPKSPKVVPNPTVGGRAVFEFWMFEEARATVEVFNTSGRLVATLLEDEWLIVGPQALLLDLGHMPNGTYFVRLTTPESNLTAGFVKY
ncbi:MAG: T9SS type A sorting domain-containing protein [Saprospiraceae bacterium]|nr:T9SS type A sorting domain-containing protein [Saprospiraceae bacterium]